MTFLTGFVGSMLSLWDFWGRITFRPKVLVEDIYQKEIKFLRLPINTLIHVRLEANPYVPRCIFLCDWGK